MSRRRGITLALVASLAAATAAGCGVPRDSTAHPIDPARVPYGLLSTGPAPVPGAGSTGRGPVIPQVFFLAGGSLRPVTLASDRAAGVEAGVDAVLERLTEGPTETERAGGMSSALGPGVGLTLVDVTDRVARISLRPSDQPPSADRAPLAVAQVVFTVTSVDGVDRVQLLRAGRTIDVPLPGGARTVEPVGASDYLSLLTIGPAPSL